LLGEDAGMASSSKRRASSSKQSSAGKARVISVGRKDSLARKGNVSAGRHKPAAPPPVDAPKEPLATALARSNKKAHKLQQTETSASRTKTASTAGRASGKLKKPAAMEVMRVAAAVAPGTVEVATPAPVAEKRAADVVEAPAPIAPAVKPEMVTTWEAVAQTVDAVEAAMTADEVSAMAALEVPEGQALPVVETEVEVEASAILEETTIVEAPFAPAPHPGKRALVMVVSRLLSTLCRWTGVRQ
jgi:hypothetical protein